MKLSEKKLRRSAEHVYYEISMLFFATQQLTKKPPNQQFSLNILLEACAIHTRNLLKFFYTPVKDRYKDDMVAEDYVADVKLFKAKRAKWSKLDHLSKRVDKQIVHLTYHRNRYNKKTKPWNFGDIYVKLYPTIVAFYESLPGHRKKWIHFLKLKKIIDIWFQTRLCHRCISWAI